MLLTGQPRNFVSILLYNTSRVSQHNYLFLDCWTHNRRLCYECRYAGLCDGQPASGCEILTLTDFDSKLKHQFSKLDEQFDEINQELKKKKEEIIEMYRKDPRFSREEAVRALQKIIQDFDSHKDVVVCQSFSDDNVNVDVSSCRRIVKLNAGSPVGYCFLNHPKIEKNQVLQWTVRVPKFHCEHIIGMVISNNLLPKNGTNEYKNFDFLDITF